MRYCNTYVGEDNSVVRGKYLDERYTGRYGENNAMLRQIKNNAYTQLSGRNLVGTVTRWSLLSSKGRSD